MATRVVAKIGPGEGPRQLMCGLENPHIEISGLGELCEVLVVLERDGVELGTKLAFAENGRFPLPEADYARVVSPGAPRTLIASFCSAAA